jgi:hypothetical protein
MKSLVFVVPLFKSESHILHLIQLINQSILTKGNSISILLILDGCNSAYDFIEIEQKSSNINRLLIYKLENNCGQYIATFEGVKKAITLNTDVIITMDSDSYKVIDLVSKINHAIVEDYDAMYFDLQIENVRLARSLGSFLFKIGMYVKTNFLVFKNGSSLRIIKKSYLLRIVKMVSNPMDFDMFILRNSNKIKFIDATKEDTKSAYKGLDLINTFFSFIFHANLKINIEPKLIYDIKNE